MVIGVTPLDFGGSAASGAPESESAPATAANPAGAFDPARASGTALHLIRTACDGLTSLDNSTGESRPSLAKNLTVETGGLKLTLDLKPRRKFADGTSVDAEAVRESLSRVARPATASRWASLLERVSGFAEVQSAQATHLTGIRVVAPLKMEIEFTAPAGDFPATLAHPSLTPISPGNKTDGASALNCSGPYRVEPGASQGSFNLKKNGREKSPGPNSIRVESFETAADSFAALIEGKVDLAQRPESQTEIPTGIRVERRSGSELTYLSFDTSKPPGSDPNFVRALSLSMDRLVIVDAAYGDRRQPALQWLPSRTDPQDSSCAKYIRRIANPELAKETLGGFGGVAAPKGTDSGAPEAANPPRSDGSASAAVDLTYDASVFDRFAAQAIEVQIKAAVGVDVRLKALESEAFTASARERPEGGAWIFETDTDFTSADQSLFELFATGRPGNRLAYSNADIDLAFEAWRRAVAQDAGVKAATQAENLLCAQTPAVPLWRRVHHWAFNPSKVTLDPQEPLDTFGMPVLRR